MELTSTQARIVRQLRRDRVAQWSTLADQLGCSTKTIQRALAQVGYWCSINYNATFVTARDTPRFDERGLWTYQRVCFSAHGNLPQTLYQLVTQSPAGLTVEELEQLVGTRVHNQVSRLIREGKLGRFLAGRTVVYLAAAARRRTAQQQARCPAPPSAVPPADVPPGLDAVTVIHVLRRLLETPQASVASLARALQARQLAVRADQIRQILDFYGLKKTTR